MGVKNWFGLLAIGMIAFTGVMLETAMNVAFPTLATAFDTNIGVVSWLTTAYLLVLAVVMPVSAYLRRAFTLRQLFFAADVLFIIGTALAGFAPNITVLIILRIVQASGVGVAIPLLFNYVIEKTPKHMLGEIMGVATLMIAVAPAAGPAYGGVLLTNISWQSVFFIATIIPVAAMILALFSLEKEPARAKHRFDAAGWALLSVGLVVFVIGVQQLYSHIFMAIGLLLIGGFLIFLFARRSKTEAEPLLNLRPFRYIQFTQNTIAFFLLYFSGFSSNLVLPTYIQNALHGSAQASGLAIVPGALLGALLAPVSGRIFDRHGGKSTILSGLLIQTVAFFSICLVLYIDKMTLPLLILLYTIFFVGFGFSAANIRTMCSISLPGSLQADANGIITTLQQISGAIGAVFASTLLLVITPTNKSTFVVFAILGAILLLVLIVMIFQFARIRIEEKSAS